MTHTFTIIASLREQLKRPVENQYSSWSRKKPRAPQYSSGQLTAIKLFDIFEGKVRRCQRKKC